MNAIETAADEVVKTILALRALTAETGTRTTKTQNDLLQSLPGRVLALVATRLYELKTGTK